MMTQPGITMPKNLTSCIQTAPGGNGSSQPPNPLTGFDFFESDELEQHTHASAENEDIEPNLATLTEDELYKLVRKSISSLRLYDWSPKTGWTLISQEEAQA